MGGMKRDKCGTTAGYRHHDNMGETPCDDCRQAIADYNRQLRRSKGSQPRTTPQHGTHSGWVNLHMKRGIPGCTACRDAHRAWQKEYRDRKQRARRRGSWLDVILDYLETFGPITPQELVWRISQRHPDVNPMTVRKALIRLEDRGLVVFERWAQNDVEVQVSEKYLDSVDAV